MSRTTTSERRNPPEASSDRMPTVVIDTREQEPYVFGPERVKSIRRALPAGDYSIEGLETQVAVERKTLDDFVSTAIWSRARFHRELARLGAYPASCVVVEGGLDDLLRGRFRSNAHASAILGAAVSIIVDHGVPVFFCSNRQAARAFVERYLLRCHRKYA